MYLHEAKPCSFVRRIWEDDVYIIMITANRDYFFMNQDENGYWLAENSVKQSSIVWEHNDFEYCSRHGGPVNKAGIASVNKCKKEDIMSKRNVNYIGGEYDIAMCSYLGESQQYAFKTPKGVKVNENDLVVVESSKGYGLCQVNLIVENNIDNAEIVSKATAWVVDVVDMTLHNARIDATKKREYIIQQLEEKKKSLEAISMYQLLADVDPDAKKLVEELKALT